MKYGAIALLLGPWGLPWGIFWTLEALADDLQGGKQPGDANATLLRAVGTRLLQVGNQSEAVRALEASLTYEDHPDVHALLWSLDASTSAPLSSHATASIPAHASWAVPLRPGHAVRGPTAPLFRHPEMGARAERHLDDHTGIVTAVDGQWVEMVVPGVGQFWTMADQLMFAEGSVRGGKAGPAT